MRSNFGPTRAVPVPSRQIRSRWTGKIGRVGACMYVYVHLGNNGKLPDSQNGYGWTLRCDQQSRGADEDAILLCAKTLEQTCGKIKFLVGAVLCTCETFSGISLRSGSSLNSAAFEQANVRILYFGSIQNPPMQANAPGIGPTTLRKYQYEGPTGMRLLSSCRHVSHSVDASLLFNREPEGNF